MSSKQRVAALLGSAVVIGGAVVTASAEPTHAATSAARPAAEVVPSSVDHVQIAFRDSSDSTQNRTVKLHGTPAQHMVALFNALKREPPGTMHCQAMSTSHTTVTFRGTTHTWVATEAICTDVMVSRDGQHLPTLLESKAWNDALTHYLGHSPTAPGSAAPAG